MAKSKVKRLYRSRNEKMVSGICGGIADYFNLDPTLIRIAWVLILLLTGVIPGLIVYLIGHIIIPEK